MYQWEDYPPYKNTNIKSSLVDYWRTSESFTMLDHLVKLLVRGQQNTKWMKHPAFRNYVSYPTTKLIENRVVRSPFDDIAIPNLTINGLIWDKIDQWPDRVAVECAVSGKQYTFSQLRTLSHRFATSLRNEGFLPGDVISIILPNVPEYSVVLLGALEAGLVVSPINPIYTSYELSHQLEDNEASVAVTIPSLVPKLEQTEKEITLKRKSKYSLRKIVVQMNWDTGISSGSMNFEEMVNDRVKIRIPLSERTSHDIALLPYSSGTTGLPKGVQLTHKNIVSNILQLDDYEVGYLYSTTRDYQEIIVGFLPFFHLYGLGNVFLRSLYHGCKLLAMPKFEASHFLTILKHQKISVLHVVPPITLLLATDKAVTKDHLTSVKCIFSGGAPPSVEDKDAIIRKAKKYIPFTQAYGATETGPVACATPLRRNDFLYFVPIANTSLKILKSDGTNVEANEQGEICIKGPQVMMGYHNKPELTKKAIDVDGFFHTGDSGFYNEEGVLTVVGRIKELIKVKGFQVSPIELETLLRDHPDILDAAVIGIPDQRSGEKPLAYVVKEKRSRVDEAEVQKFVAEKVSPYKRLANVVFVDSIPKSSTGKILRRVLEEESRKAKLSNRR